MKEKQQPCLKELIKLTLFRELLPTSADSLAKILEHFHLALFFVWQKYYEFAKRLCRI
jgi:hypothetical protein